MASQILQTIPGQAASPMDGSTKTVGDMNLHNSTQSHPLIEDTISLPTRAGSLPIPNDDDHLSNVDESDSDSDDNRLVQNTPPKPRQISEKKRADYQKFMLFLEENQRNLQPNNRAAVEDPDARSAEWLVRDDKSRRIIESPRDYQIELFERAKDRNVIAVLDTGSGKTLIAVLLLRYIIEQELEARARDRPKRLSFFLVDKVALVFQQHAVLESNLDQPIAKFCGGLTTGLALTDWKKIFAESMVVVCTADILQSCLTHGYLSMGQINLLIFDEAHHAKKNHVYSRIVKEFYIGHPPEGRPKIFGMTASPVDAQGDIRKATLELEGLLHSEIATVADPSLIQKSVCKPKTEKIVHYDRLCPPHFSGLTQKLHSLIGEHSAFERHFEFAKMAYSDLGPWCADRFWELVLTEEETLRFQAKSERDYTTGLQRGSSVDAHVEAVRDARSIIEGHPFPPLNKSHLSSKVKQLYSALSDQFGRPGGSKTKCIVFVERRFTATALADLFHSSRLRVPGLHAAALVGVGFDDGASRNSYRDQVVTLIKFKKGILNCLFATSVAEEGLDIPDCNLIIRYDLYNTMIQYIQSRGRARQENSTYIHMLEAGNASHYSKVHQNQRNEQALRHFCSTVPEERKLRGYNFNMDYFLKKDRKQRQLVIESTGAKLGYKQSLIILAEFVATLPHAPEISLIPEYTVTYSPEGFVGEVLLPAASPIRSAVGKPHSSKQVAKCSAAFEMCYQLLQAKYLTEHLKSVFTKQLPAMRSARLAISSKKKGEYKMRSKPELWSQKGEPKELFATVLILTEPESMEHASRPLILFTRQALPDFAPFRLHFGKGRSSRVAPVAIATPISTDHDVLSLLTTFTLRIFHDVFSKEYEATASDLPFFIAPSAHSHTTAFSPTSDVMSLADWDLLKYVSANPVIPYEGNEPDDFFQQKYVIDLHDGSRKFIVQKLRKDLRPSDPVPDSVPAPANRQWRLGQVKHDILNYSVSLWAKSRARATFRDEQPVVEAKLLPHSRNLLDDQALGNEVREKTCYLILEPLRISALPLDAVAMAYNLPSILHRLEAQMVAVDACKAIGLDIPAGLALEALTKDSDNTDEHDAEQINFQEGMGSNYERLEFLGDAFLKMASTIALYTLIPDKDEFEYHVERMCLVCNKNLFNNALEMHIEEYIRSQAFERRAWYPDLILKRGKSKKPRTSHVLGDKSIADVCEAFIGAAYLTSCQQGNFDLAVRAVTIMVANKNHPMKSYEEYYAAYTKPQWQTAPATATQANLALKIKEQMGYEFQCPRLLRSAFMHPSYPRSYENLPSYQRLEFLGDALLDMATIEHLFRTNPDRDPQWLTEHKMAMVSNQFLGILCAELGFHRHLVSLSAPIQRQVGEWIAEATQAKEEAQDRAEKEGKSREDYPRDYWVQVSQPPKCLPDIVEAYVGALFVDSEYDYGAVTRFFERHVLPFFRDMHMYDTFANKHPVTFAANLLSTRFRCREWRVVVEEVDVPEDDLRSGTVSVFETRVSAGFMVHGQVVGCAVAASGRYAKVAAAKQALAKLEELKEEEFRELTGCDCGNRADGGGGDGQDEGVEGDAMEEHATAI
ncbi:uncharacterized protein E0L32_008576 [Thyridium curvatum]|uniref:Dicer-like protein 1 n=1 Tax=Thyridium curvatum TaxID=1093900 RepID=A0A507AUY3_9PEZI|nr:uncharacterized protein E0L32_008576 [Thyridium curvatum]TPX10526.1 hypothetical protein E0L32_008576 [Thyridium curvatum]